MSKQVSIIIGVIVLIVLAGGAYLVLNNNDSSTQSSTNKSNDGQQQTAQSEENASVEGNIASISSGGKARQCTFSYSGSNGTSNGSMYTDGNGRGLMTMDVVTEKGNTGTSNTLITTDKAYSWTTTDGKTVGFAFDKSKLTTNTSSTTTQSSATQDASKNYSMQCKAWSVDNTKLSPPSDINFATLPI